jgi:hypothetical protein
MKHDIELPWNEFKAQVLDVGTWQWIYFDTADHYKIFAKQNDFTAICKIFKDSGSDQTDFETNYQTNATTTFVSKSQTRFERDDIRLKMSRAEATFASGEAEVSFKLPGEVGVDPVFIGGGYAFTDVFTFGDCVEKVQIVDVDDILGYGEHTVIATYHDETESDSNKGWYMWPMPIAGGEVEVEPLGYYGEAIAGLYLELYFKSTAATKVYVDFILGRLA